MSKYRTGNGCRSVMHVTSHRRSGGWPRSRRPKTTPRVPPVPRSWGPGRPWIFRVFIARLTALLKHSLPTAALIREILYSHSLLKRAILANLHQKIAKLQANVGGPNGRSAANF